MLSGIYCNSIDPVQLLPVSSTVLNEKGWQIRMFIELSIKPPQIEV